MNYQHLKTNHLSHFNAGDFILGYQSSPNFTMGVGIQFAYGRLHNDNGYNLRHIRILPVFADFRYEFLPKHIVSPFLIADVGYSTFIRYRKIDPRHIEPTANIKESGIYTFGGCGLMFHINKHITANIGTGFTGTHMSLDNNDVNPRGLTFRFGVKFNL